MFEKAKNMFKLQREARQIKKELHNIHIEAEVEGIIVVINGEQEVISIIIPPEALADPQNLKQNLIKCFNKGIKKSQQVAAEKMKGVMGGLGLGTG